MSEFLTHVWGKAASERFFVERAVKTPALSPKAALLKKSDFRFLVCVNSFGELRLTCFFVMYVLFYIFLQGIWSTSTDLPLFLWPQCKLKAIVWEAGVCTNLHNTEAEDQKGKEKWTSSTCAVNLCWLSSAMEFDRGTVLSHSHPLFSLRVSFFLIRACDRITEPNDTTLALSGSVWCSSWMYLIHLRLFEARAMTPVCQVNFVQWKRIHLQNLFTSVK